MAEKHPWVILLQQGEKKGFTSKMKHGSGK